jgi:hypothetical protein
VFFGGKIYCPPTLPLGSCFVGNVFEAGGSPCFTVLMNVRIFRSCISIFANYSRRTFANREIIDTGGIPKKSHRQESFEWLGDSPRDRNEEWVRVDVHFLRRTLTNTIFIDSYPNTDNRKNKKKVLLDRVDDEVSSVGVTALTALPTLFSGIWLLVWWHCK